MLKPQVPHTMHKPQLMTFRLETHKVEDKDYDLMKSLAQRFYATHVNGLRSADGPNLPEIKAELADVARAAGSIFAFTPLFLSIDERNVCEAYTALGLAFLDTIASPEANIAFYFTNTLEYGTSRQGVVNYRTVGTDHLKTRKHFHSWVNYEIFRLFHQRRMQFLVISLEGTSVERRDRRFEPAVPVEKEYLPAVIVNPNFAHPSIRSVKGGYRRHLASQLRRLAEKKSVLVVLDPYLQVYHWTLPRKGDESEENNDVSHARCLNPASLDSASLNCASLNSSNLNSASIKSAHVQA